jgi:glycerol-3-phosphate dehydrogenase (NAD+)
MQMVSLNAAQNHLFNSTVKMWVFQEEWQGGNLTDKMNELKENPKYLPGVKYGDNVVACADLVETIQDADLIIFCTPHQFVQGLCRKMQMHVKPTSHAISLIKGMYVNPETGPQLITSMIRKMLSIECSVLMGANIATEIAPNGLCESTIASHNVEHGNTFKCLFDTPFFSVNVIADVEGAELAGTLKNIVAIAAGFSDGCQLGENAKAAILRQGLLEMRQFAKAMFPTVRDETFYESCGMADLIATCYGGRNHKVAQAFAESNGKKSFAELESDLLKGQKLQGVLTSEEVMLVLKSRHWIKDYPLFTLVDVIACGLLPPRDISRFHEFTKSSSTLEELVHPKKKGGGRRMSLLEVKRML